MLLVNLSHAFPCLGTLLRSVNQHAVALWFSPEETDGFLIPDENNLIVVDRWSAATMATYRAIYREMLVRGMFKFGSDYDAIHFALHHDTLFISACKATSCPLSALQSLQDNQLISVLDIKTGEHMEADELLALA